MERGKPEKSIEFLTRTKDKPFHLLRMGVDIRKMPPLCVNLPAVMFNDDAAFLTVRINQTLTATGSQVRTMEFRGYQLDKMYVGTPCWENYCLDYCPASNLIAGKLRWIGGI